jgi:structure-specific endonuclease subunit SLX1
MSHEIGRMQSGPARPKASLTDKISNLHLLLRVSYFSSWPLNVRFFTEDVYRVWQGWCESVDAQLLSKIKVIPDFGLATEAANGLKGAGAVPSLPERLKRLEISYEPLKSYVEKSKFILEADDEVFCGICKSMLDLETDSIIICSEGECRSASHMTCLASRFLKESNTTSAFVPIEGLCPACRSRLQWATLVKEMMLRMYGEKEVKKLFRKKREVTQPDDWEGGEDDLDDPIELTAANVAGEDLDLEDTEDSESVASAGSDVPDLREVRTFKLPPRLSMLVEETDWENAERVD